MLVLSRKRYEKIVVDGPCVIVVVDIRGDKVRIGIEADHGVLVDREEVRERRIADQAAQESALPAPDSPPTDPWAGRQIEIIQDSPRTAHYGPADGGPPPTDPEATGPEGGAA